MTTREKRKKGNDPVCFGLPILFILVMIVVPVHPARAWTQGALGVDQTWTDNIFLLSDKEQDWIASPFLSLRFGPFAGWSPYYFLEGNLFAYNPDLNGLQQEVGLDFEKPIGLSDSGHFFGFGLHYQGSLHVDESQSMDYHEFGADLGFSLRPDQSLLIRPELGGAYRTFPNEGDLSFVETGVSLLINKSFQTATTLRFLGRVDYKQFLQEVDSETGDLTDQQTALVDAASADIQQQETFALPPLNAGQNNGSGGSGQGSGQSGSGESGSSSGSGNNANSSSSGSGMGNRGDSQTGSVGNVNNTDSVQAAQAYASIRIAQSFLGSVGAYLEGSYRYNLLDPPRYVEGLLPAMDREIFDDHYGYQGPGAQTQISVLMPLGFSWKIRGDFELRQYEDRDALDEQGLPLDPAEERLDQRIEVQTGFSYSHDFRLPFPAFVRAGIDYGHVWNLSNDVFYDAEENWFLLSVNLGW